MAASAVELIVDLLSTQSKESFSNFANFKLIVHSVLYDLQIVLDDQNDLEVRHESKYHVPTDFFFDDVKEHQYKSLLYSKIFTVFVYPGIDGKFRISVTVSDSFTWV